jgi:serine protease Do
MRHSGRASGLALLACSLTAASCGGLGGAGGTGTSTVTVTVAAPTSSSATASAPSSSSAPSSADPSSSSSSAPAPSTATSDASATLQGAFEAVRSGVVRFEVAGCDGEAIGSGFAVAPSLVATAAHVVAGGQVIRIIQGTSSTAGRVIGLDAEADVALVRTASPLSGTTLTFAAHAPRVGDKVGALGFPEGDPLSFNQGTVNGLDRKAVIDGIQRHSMIEIDAATTHGSSGGPVIEADGGVVGLVDAGPDGEPGRRLAVSSAVAKPLVEAWTVGPQPVRPPSCASVRGPDGEPLPASDFPTTEARQALATLDVYFRSINNGDFPTAVAQLLHPGSLAAFAKGVTSSNDSDFKVNSVSSRSGSPVVWLDFSSQQDPGQGPAGRRQETCTRWSLDFSFAQHHGLWLIESTRAHTGRPASQPCRVGDSGGL